MRRLCVLAGVFSGLVLGGVQANAAKVFFEDFDEVSGATTNFTGFDQFTVDMGAVDTFINGGFGLTCPNLGCVDLDGSTGVPGNITSTPDFVIGPGDYELSFNLGGHQRGGSDTMTVGLTSLLSFGVARDASGPYSVETLSFSLAGREATSIFFDHDGGDNVGMLLDWVRLERPDDMGVIPLPAATWFLLTGMAGLAAFGRRKKS